MKSMWIWLSFDALAAASSTQEREALAERDVAGGVLVEQRVVEDRVELADAALARRPARPRRAGRRRRRAGRSCAACPAPCRRRSARRARPRSAPAGRARRSRRPARAACVEVTWPSARSGSGVVNTSSVGRFGMCSMPSTVSKRAACQRDAGQQADRQVGARRPRSAARRSARSVRRSATADERVGARAPRRDRVVLVEPQHVQQLARRAAASASSAGRSGNTSAAHAGVGPGRSSSWSCGR